MRLPRFRLRTLVVAVAGLAVAVAMASLSIRSAAYSQLAEYHRVEAFRSSYPGALNGPARLARHLELHSKYERAARYPWLPVAPDPPPPLNREGTP